MRKNSFCKIDASLMTISESSDDVELSFHRKKLAIIQYMSQYLNALGMVDECLFHKSSYGLFS